MEIFDITIPLHEKTPVWEGDKGVTIKRVARLSHGSDFNVSRIEMGAHSGTHVDAPFHLFDDGRTVDTLPVETLIGEVQILQIGAPVEEISPEILIDSGLSPEAKRLLLKTRNSQFWKDDPYSFRKDFVALNARAAAYLVEAGVQLVGIDYFSISPMVDLKTPHEILLRAGVIILENVNLLEIEAGWYQLICLPLKLAAADGAPARVILTRN